MKTDFKNNKAEQGLSLVELLVVLALFMAIVGTATSIFISIVSQQKRILAEQDLLNQVSYAQEYMTRATRSAVLDFAGDCLVDGQSSYSGSIYLLTHYNEGLGVYQGIKFINKDNECQEFFLDQNDGSLKESKDGNQPVNIISNVYELNSVGFIIDGNETTKVVSQSDSVQPRVSILINVKADSSFSFQDQLFQTTVSQRNLNIP